MKKPIYTQKILQNDLLKYLPDVNMSDRDKEIISRYFEERSTYKNIGDRYNLSDERIRQIIVQFYWKAFHMTSRSNEYADINY